MPPPSPPSRRTRRPRWPPIHRAASSASSATAGAGCSRRRRASILSSAASTAAAGSRSARATGSSTATGRDGISAACSLKGYKLVELSTNSLGHARGRVDLQARAGWRDATQVAYHGLGIDSPQDRSSFRMKQAYGGGTLGFRPVSWVVLGAGATVEDFTLEEGEGTYPSIEEIYTPESAPGLGANPTFLHAVASAGIDSRPSPGYRGGAGSTKSRTTTSPTATAPTASIASMPRSSSTCRSCGRTG